MISNRRKLAIQSRAPHDRTFSKMNGSASKPPNERKPWPMTWVIAAIAIYIVAYTAINLGFRKSEPAHEPWAEAQLRRQELAEQAMGDWTRVPAALAPSPAPAAQTGAVAVVSRESAPERLERALPPDLVAIILRKPELADAPALLSASAAIRRESAEHIHLRYDDAPDASRFGEVLAYAKDQHLWVFLQDETRAVPGTTPLSVAPVLDLELNTAELAPGEWRATVHCRDAVFNWTFRVD